ncbi:MAG: helicase-related protein, partial [Phascolarctobacterium sp.]|nr:helicase-related protein [Phascolarctobacterium sp.]
EQDLNAAYLDNLKRNELIYKHYLKYHPQRALGFCCSRAHAEMMARDFCARGVPAVAVYSNAQSEYAVDRQEAISRLIRGELKVIFSVDMFNEGVDIPSVDMVMFLRPTESPVVFLQQLGRGLRLSKGKKYLNVLDFIGNYAKAERAPFLLAGSRTAGGGTGGARSFTQLDYPDDCLVDFDMPLIDLFERLTKRRMNIREHIAAEFIRVQELLGGKVPTRRELFTYMEDNIYALCLKNTKENIFKNYLEYRAQQGLLSEAELELYHGPGRELLHLVETTDMTKVYKMPVLMAFYNHGNIRLQVSEEELLASWKEFFSQGTNWQDLKKDITREEYLAISDKAHLGNILRNPVKFLKASGRGFFVERDGYPIALAEALAGAISNPAFAAELKDIIEYRTLEYYRSRYEAKK